MQSAYAHYGFGLVLPKVKVPSVKFEWMVLVQVALCVLPAMGLVALGNPAAGAKWLFAVLLLLLTWCLLTKNRLGFVSLTVSSIPALMLLRGFFFYNSATALLALGIILWFFASPKEFFQSWRDIRWRCLLLIGVLYWLLSYVMTGEYFSNLRVLELVFSAASIHLLAKHRGYLATALTGMTISAFAVGLAFLPSGGDRLGHDVIDGYILGNPITFGIPLALIFLLSIADGGKWLLLQNHPYWRLALGMTSGAFLLLSTSRGSLAIVIVNVIVLLFIGKRQRWMLLVSLALLVLITFALLQTERGPSIVRFYDRTFSPDRTLNQKTGGRTEQWTVFPRAFQDSPVWGFGPGSGESVYAEYSLLIDSNLNFAGMKMAWHSLYLHIGVEAGLIGILALTLLLGSLIFHGLTHWRSFGESIPLLGVIGFLVIGLSVSGTDSASGIFLGLGLLSVRRKPAPRFRWEHGGEKLRHQLSFEESSRHSQLFNRSPIVQIVTSPPRQFFIISYMVPLPTSPLSVGG